MASEIYGEWIALLDEIGIDLLMCGHMHASYALPPHAEGKKDAAFPTFVSSNPVKKDGDGRPYYTGAALEVKNGKMTAYVVKDGVRTEAVEY